ncbi:MAG: VacJ family lipoprotein [Verrucomicrobiaceae bacterium]|nr:VacJ family lipoprotein [Verrucomicrobiaceae bacterium]
MNICSTLPRLFVLASCLVLTQCAAPTRKGKLAATPPAIPSATHAMVPETKAAPALTDTEMADELDDYAVIEISDPLERLNRGTFWVNDKMYLVLFRPLSKGYEKVLPQRLRKGIDNVFENARYPVRLVNCALQGKFRRAGLETEKFVLNTVGGLGGLMRVSEKIPSLQGIAEEDTGKTFATWGLGHGAYLVIPFLGPSSVRDGIGLIGDYALNPANWGAFWGGKHDWTIIPPSVNTLRALPSQLSAYDEAKRDSIDPYIALRSAYVQYRAEAVKK